MNIWEVRGVQPDKDLATTLYINAPSEGLAREYAAHRGLRVETVRWILANDLPGGSKVHSLPETDPDDALRLIAHSPLIQRPVRTIALGVLLGALLSYFVTWILVVIVDGPRR
ncbi:MAG: hypothetical protein AABZ53_08665 [Planctomycetota bacterium]